MPADPSAPELPPAPSRRGNSSRRGLLPLAIVVAALAVVLIGARLWRGRASSLVAEGSRSTGRSSELPVAEAMENGVKEYPGSLISTVDSAHPTAFRSPPVKEDASTPTARAKGPVFLPTPGPAEPGENAGRVKRMAELTQQIADQKDPALRDRIRLALAGHQVGQGDWLAARKVYEDIAATTNDPVLRNTAFRNLSVANKQLEVLGESDAVRREELQLELAGLHQLYGHERAAKQIWRDLATRAQSTSVREEAARLQYIAFPRDLPPLPSTSQ
jgi:hypothetical protein